MNDVHTLAERYLMHLSKTGMASTKVFHGDKAHTPYADEQQITESYLWQLSAEFKASKRFDVDDIPQKFVLKYGHKYFYGLKANEPKWTYDIKLALAVDRILADEWLRQLGKDVTIFPAPDIKEGAF